MPSINNFIKSFNNEVARPSKFNVTINVPQIFLKYSSEVIRKLTFRCETAELPGRTFGTVDQKFGSNPTLKFPMHSSYNDLTLTFIVSGDMSEKRFFDAWMEVINPTLTFDFSYKNTFVSDIKVVQYDLSDIPTYSVNLFNAYPIVVNQLDLDWSTDSYHKLSVVFAYDYWQNDNLVELNNSGIIPTTSPVNDIGNFTAGEFGAAYNTVGFVPNGSTGIPVPSSVQPTAIQTNAAALSSSQQSTATNLGIPSSTPGFNPFVQNRAPGSAFVTPAPPP